MRCPKCKMPTFMKLGGNTSGCGSCGYFERNASNGRNKTCKTCENKNCSYRGTGYNACNRYIDK